MIRVPKNITVLLGETAYFYCLALSFSGLLYDWKRKDNAMLPSSAIKSYNQWPFSSFYGRITTFYNLQINNTESSDEGWYCCEAGNECGVTKECAWLEVNCKLNVNNYKICNVLATCSYMGVLCLYCSPSKCGYSASTYPSASRKLYIK